MPVCKITPAFFLTVSNKQSACQTAPPKISHPQKANRPLVVFANTKSIFKINLSGLHCAWRSAAEFFQLAFAVDLDNGGDDQVKFAFH